MIEHINEVAVLVTTLLAIAVGSIWYSPLLFGKQWMIAVGLTEEDMEAAKPRMPKLYLFGAIANFFAVYATAYFLTVAQGAGIDLLSLSVWLIVLLSAFAISTVIWERKPLSYFFINIGYMAVVIIGGMHVIAYWPW